MEVSSQPDVPAALSQGKDPAPRYSFHRRLRKPPGWVWTRWQREKFFASAWNRTPVIQPVA